MGRIAAKTNTPDEAITLSLKEIKARDASIGAFVSINHAARGASAADIGSALALLADIPPMDAPDPARKYRVGIVAQEFAGQPERAATRALEIAADAFQRAGSSVRQFRLPEIFAEAWRSHSIVQAFEAHQSLSWEYDRHHEALPPRLRGKLDSTRGIGRAEYDDALSVARRARSEIEATFRQVDLILTVSASGPAPRGLSSIGETNFNRLWTLLGVPCVNVPIYPDAEQLPVGVQVIASYGADRRAIEAAGTLESALKAQRCLGA
jgi:Asp-tRNA(Asn)/Glu-tRNA(Gln) amidotransferase A subunit family amidase